MPLSAYLAADGFESQLASELGTVLDRHGRLLVCDGPARRVAWAANVWQDPQVIRIESIKDGVRKLRQIQRNWALYSHAHHRRAALIQEQLPHVSAKPLIFPEPVPKAALGSWTLLDKDTILASPACSSPFPHGEARFVEDKQAPPNRAYLKLFEALTLHEQIPGPDDLVLDLGSSPGGWTWVLAQLGCRVISIDKAPLDPRIQNLPGVEFRAGSAFAIEPDSFEQIDWLCCDVACYPQRLLAMVRRWLDAGTCRHFVCTVKLQGDTDHATTAEFAAIPGSRLLHLHHNKHELTWMW